MPLIGFVLLGAFVVLLQTDTSDVFKPSKLTELGNFLPHLVHTYILSYSIFTTIPPTLSNSPPHSVHTLVILEVALSGLSLPL